MGLFLAEIPKLKHYGENTSKRRVTRGWDINTWCASHIQAIAHRRSLNLDMEDEENGKPNCKRLCEVKWKRFGTKDIERDVGVQGQVTRHRYPNFKDWIFRDMKILLINQNFDK